MKSYLSLIPISAKVRRRQNRMTILCIVISVFLVTAVFSMADMAIRMETSNRIEKDGSWHLLLRDISASTASEISKRDDIAAFSPYGDLNSSINQNYFVDGKQAAICGAEKDLAKMLPGFQNETYPSDDEVIVTSNILDTMNVTIGDSIPLTMPNGSTKSLKIVVPHSTMQWYCLQISKHLRIFKIRTKKRKNSNTICNSRATPICEKPFQKSKSSMGCRTAALEKMPIFWH